MKQGKDLVAKKDKHLAKGIPASSKPTDKARTRTVLIIEQTTFGKTSGKY